MGPVGNVERLRRSFLRRPVVGLLTRAGAIFSATGTGAAELVGAGIPPDRVAVKDLVVDTGHFTPASAAARQAGRQLLDARTPHTIVYAGRFDLRQKHLALLIEAWGTWMHPSGKLVLVGEGPDEPVLVGLAASSQANVRLHGWVDDAAEALQGADAFVLPTHFENPGYALFEGMACGLPGVASEIDVYREHRTGRGRSGAEHRRGLVGGADEPGPRGCRRSHPSGAAQPTVDRGQHRGRCGRRAGRRHRPVTVGPEPLHPHDSSSTTSSARRFSIASSFVGSMARVASTCRSASSYCSLST